MADSTNKRQKEACPLATDGRPLAVTTLADDVLGIIYSKLEKAEDRCNFYHAHPTFWKSRSINSRIRSLKLLDVKPKNQLESFPRHAAGIKTLTFASSSSMDFKTALDQLLSSTAVSVRANLGGVECLALERCTLATEECAESFLRAFVHLQAVSGSLTLNECVLSDKFLSSVGSHSKLHKLVLDCCTLQAPEGNGIDPISTFSSLRELSFKGAGFSHELCLHELKKLQQLHTLSLSGCMGVGLKDFLAAVPLQILHLHGTAFTEMNADTYIWVPDIASTTLRELSLDKLDEQSYGGFDICNVPALEKFELGCIDVATASWPDLDEMVSWLADLPLCIGNGFKLQLSWGEDAGEEMRALVPLLQNALREKKIIVTFTGPLDISEMDTLSSGIGNLVNGLDLHILGLQAAHRLTGSALLHAVQKIGSLSSLTLHMKPFGAIPDGILAALLEAAARKRLFTLHMHMLQPEEMSELDNAHFEVVRCYASCDPGMAQPDSLCEELQRQWSRIQAENLVPGCRKVKLEVS